LVAKVNVFAGKSFNTYCKNFDFWSNQKLPTINPLLKGLIIIKEWGQRGHFLHMPWDDNNEPRFNQPTICHICGVEIEDGCLINHNGEELGFCRVEHYLEWWSTIHGDPANIWK
jgi:hypothetical protein